MYRSTSYLHSAFGSPTLYSLDNSFGSSASRCVGRTQDSSSRWKRWGALWWHIRCLHPPQSYRARAGCSCTPSCGSGQAPPNLRRLPANLWQLAQRKGTADFGQQRQGLCGLTAGRLLSPVSPARGEPGRVDIWHINPSFLRSQGPRKASATGTSARFFARWIPASSGMTAFVNTP